MNFSVVLLEQKPFVPLRVGETLPGEIIKPLTRLGIWGEFLADGQKPSPGTVAFWGSMEPYENDFLYSPYGAGWHLDRVRFDRMLLESAATTGAHVYSGARMEAWQREESGIWVLRTQINGESSCLRAKLLIDATGRSSKLGSGLGVRKQVCDRLISLAAFTSNASTSDPRTLIEACQDGWWYFAPLPNGRAASTFFTDSDLLPRGMDHLRQFWKNRLAETRLISAVMPVDEDLSLFAVSCATTKLDHAAGDGWLAVGDAAQSYDPLSGQGVMRALTSGIAAADAIARRRSGDIHAFNVFGMDTNLQFERYQADCALYYARESRWADSVFWRRRRLTGMKSRITRSMGNDSRLRL